MDLLQTECDDKLWLFHRRKIIISRKHSTGHLSMRMLSVASSLCFLPSHCVGYHLLLLFFLSFSLPRSPNQFLLFHIAHTVTRLFKNRGDLSRLLRKAHWLITVWNALGAEALPWEMSTAMGMEKREEGGNWTSISQLAEWEQKSIK